ncbi:MAG: tetratricopeptide repeat protein [Chloroflexaceae bacterium]|nr:tetratricopeptide repeat protein [Chloroflexaceae bacterium]
MVARVRAALAGQGAGRGEGTWLGIGNISSASYSLGDYPRAIAYYEQALTVRRAIGDVQGEAIDCWNLGLLYERQGDLRRAVALMQVAGDFYTQINHAQYAEMCSNGLARVRAALAGGSPLTP